MKIILKTMLQVALVVLPALSVSSCTEREGLSGLEERVSRLESLCSRMQTNLESTVSLLDALSANEYITGVAPIKDGDEVTGYTISFSKSSPIILYNGAAGSKPDVSVKMDSDGIYYWTVNQEWVLDDQGNKIPVKGITPRLRVEEGIWFVSMDEGKTWEKMGQCSDSAIIKSVEEQGSQVIFTLADGTRITMSKTGIIPVPETYYIAAPNNYCNISFDLPEDGREYAANAYVIGYDSGTKNPYKGIWANNCFYAEAAVCKKDNGPGKPYTDMINLYLETPQILPEHFEVHVDVLVKTDGRFRIVQSVNLPFERLVKDDAKPELVFVTSDARTLDLTAMTNADRTWVETAVGDDWITCVWPTSTRADLHEERQSVNIAINTGRLPRITRVKIVNDPGSAPIREFIVMQAGTETHVNFADPEVKRICLEHYDKDSNGEISYDEAFLSCSSYYADSPFEQTGIVSFNELKYFGLLGNLPCLFKDCTLLESVELPEYLTARIGAEAFRGCSALKTVTIPSSVIALGDRAFAQSGIEAITVPMTMKSFGNDCFQDCPNLTVFHIEEQYDGWGNRKEFEIESIPKSMFENCGKLRCIDGTVRAGEIGEKAFMNTDMSAQTSSIYTQKYGDYAFYGTKMETVDLSGNYIGAHAFENCEQLSKVIASGYGATSGSSTLPFLGVDAFRREGELIDTLVIWSNAMLYKFVDQGWTRYFKTVGYTEWTSVTVTSGDGWD